MSIIHIHDSDNKRVKLEMDIKELECPVCYNIPREFPIPACPAGHVVCKTCRVKVQKCPTCRMKFTKGGVNTLAASMIEKIPHRSVMNVLIRSHLIFDWNMVSGIYW